MDPAEDALFAEIFSDEFRRRINGWRLTIQETGRLAAPLLGAGLFVLLGGGAVAALDAATFVVAAWIAHGCGSRVRRRRGAPSRLGPALRWGLAHLRAAGLR